MNRPVARIAILCVLVAAASTAAAIAPTPSLRLVSIGALIVVNAGICFLWAWRRRDRALAVLALSLVQLALFTQAFRETYELLGPEHYRVERAPQLADWAGLTLMHVARATDIADALDVSKIGFRPIRTVGYAAGTPLVLLHLFVDFFLLTALTGLLRSLRRSPLVDRPYRAGLHHHRSGPGCGCVAVLVELAIVIAVIVGAIWFWSHWPIVVAVAAAGAGLLLLRTWTPLAPRIAARVASVGWRRHRLVGLLLAPLTVPLALVAGFWPLAAFTAMFVGVTGMIEWWWPDAIAGTFDPLWFGIENLWHGIDVLDMAPVFGWSWSGEWTAGLLAGTWIVAFRLTVSLAFFAWLYRTLVMAGMAGVLPLRSMEEALESGDPAVHESAVAALEQLPAADASAAVRAALRQLIGENAFSGFRLLLAWGPAATSGLMREPWQFEDADLFRNEAFDTAVAANPDASSALVHWLLAMSVEAAAGDTYRARTFGELMKPLAAQLQTAACAGDIGALDQLLARLAPGSVFAMVTVARNRAAALAAAQAD